MKKKLSILFLFIFCTASTCEKDKCHKTISFVNNSYKEVYIGSTIRTLDTLKFYKNFSNPYENPEAYRVKQGKKNTVALGKRNCLEHSHVADGDMFVYIFDAEVLATVPWDTIGKYYMVLKTIHPTLEEMERDNWTITFTGE